MISSIEQKATNRVASRPDLLLFAWLEAYVEAGYQPLGEA
jgi:hypothetical protein